MSDYDGHHHDTKPKPGKGKKHGGGGGGGDDLDLTNIGVGLLVLAIAASVLSAVYAHVRSSPLGHDLAGVFDFLTGVTDWIGAWCSDVWANRTPH